MGVHGLMAAMIPVDNFVEEVEYEFWGLRLWVGVLVELEEPEAEVRLEVDEVPVVEVGDVVLKASSPSRNI